jgi:hypothetical protein
MSERDEILDAVRGLPSRDVDEWRRERIRAKAHAAMEREARPLSTLLDRLERAYARTLEPAIVFGLGSAYVVWAVNQAAEILQ